MMDVHLKIGMGLFFLLAAVLSVVMIAAMVTRNSKNGERMRLIKQASSGRWLLTVMAGTAFLGLCLGVFIIMVSMRHEMKPETAVALFSSVLLIVQGVYKDYFRRDTNGSHTDEDDGGHNDSSNAGHTASNDRGPGETG